MRNKMELVSGVIGYIEDHLAEKLDLDEIASAVHYSKYHLHRVFVDAVGMTVHDYAKRRQLTEAAKLLVFSRQPIIHIALAAGYESQQSFTGSFKDMYKQTPHQFREREEFYPLQLEFDFKRKEVEPQGDTGGSREIFRAEEKDVPLWMGLVRLTVDGFPNLQEAEHLSALRCHIADGEAFLMKEGGIGIGAMMVSRRTGSIDFLAVHPLYRKQGISEQFLDRAFSELLNLDRLSITTFREGDKADPGHRKALKTLGFAEGALLTEFGYPTQRMILGKEGSHDFFSR